MYISACDCTVRVVDVAHVTHEGLPRRLTTHRSWVSLQVQSIQCHKLQKAWVRCIFLTPAEVIAVASFHVWYLQAIQFMPFLTPGAAASHIGICYLGAQCKASCIWTFGAAHVHIYDQLSQHICIVAHVGS